VTVGQWIVLVALGGGVGSGLRFWVDRAVGQRWPRRYYSLGTWVVNLTGSALLGALWAAFAVAESGGAVTDQAYFAALGTGLLGGFTTFSTASVETARIMLGSLVTLPGGPEGPEGQGRRAPSDRPAPPAGAAGVAEPSGLGRLARAAGYAAGMAVACVAAAIGGVALIL
jgi:CrcB protein